MRINITINKSKEIEILEDILIESEEKYNFLLDSFPLSILLLDYDRKVHFYNKAAELYLKTSCDNLHQKSFYEIFSAKEDIKLTLDEIISNVLLFNYSEITNLEFLNQKGSLTWVELFFSTIKIKNDTFVQVILLDITERRLAEKIIQEENKRLRDLDDVKKSLTARTSEQLKSPLSVMANASDILLNTYQDKLDPGAIKLLEIIKNGGERSLELVGKIVKISNIKSDNLVLNKQTESLYEILVDSLNSIYNENETIKVRYDLNLSEDLYSDVDKIRLKQAIEEVLTFVAKNNDDNVITLSLQESKNLGEIRIQSSFNHRIIQNLFQEITLSKEIIELHDGQMLLENIGNDSFISIRLPLKNWKKALMQLYIIYRSGVPLYDESFNKKKKNHDTSLISGGIIGLMTILKAILQGDTQIKSIDHGDRTIIFDSNITEDIIFVLIVKENITIFEKKLELLISEFDETYADLVEDIDNTSCDTGNWEHLGDLVKKQFK
jgi:PAS domain S-box-containing protein